MMVLTKSTMKLFDAHTCHATSTKLKAFISLRQKGVQSFTDCVDQILSKFSKCAYSLLTRQPSSFKCSTSVTSEISQTDDSVDALFFWWTRIPAHHQWANIMLNNKYNFNTPHMWFDQSSNSNKVSLSGFSACNPTRPEVQQVRVTQLLLIYEHMARGSCSQSARGHCSDRNEKSCILEHENWISLAEPRMWQEDDGSTAMVRKNQKRRHKMTFLNEPLYDRLPHLYTIQNPSQKQNVAEEIAQCRC